MKTIGLFLGFFLGIEAVAIASLPIITTHPTNQTVTPNQNIVLHVISTNAAAYQWRFNGVDIPWGTNSSVIITNAQADNSGYYMAVAKNSIGWTPSRMGYLSVVGSTQGIVPFTNLDDPASQAIYQFCFPFDIPITNGIARVVAGPAPDVMTTLGGTLPVGVSNGYYGPITRTRGVPSVNPGQDVYYRVDISYVNPCNSTSVITQRSTTIKLVAGGGSFPTPSLQYFRFPVYIEWPDYGWIYEPTSRVGVVGETMTLDASFYWPYPSTLTVNWRKDGKIISSATNAFPYSGRVSLTLTNLTASDCGIYDVVGAGADGITRNKVFLSVQTPGGNGLLKHPKLQGTNFICDLEGAYSRKYAILSSTNLLNWTSNLTVTLGEQTNTVTFTASTTNDVKQFYRAQLLPIP